jgi:polyphosphate kinase
MYSVIAPAGRDSHIQAIGIIDHYLEHSRVLIFHNGGKPRYFLSSADFLPRNFDSRFEVICPVYDPDLQEELREYFEIQWRDNQKARVLDRRLTNAYSPGAGSRVKVRAQESLRRWLAEKSDAGEREEEEFEAGKAKKKKKAKKRAKKTAAASGSE